MYMASFCQFVWQTSVLPLHRAVCNTSVQNIMYGTNCSFVWTHNPVFSEEILKNYKDLHICIAVHVWQ